ncbi:MAG: MOSC domain-containing protein [Candidatus Azotimanducaceae bacterium]|uniref:MOSC domain-containing protein n=1 Tax=OM182 bacterium TaxID=2510334 RepID=A0A520S5P8_9GAMM|nr:MOSC domain-containing protein [Gammaproteobacteria bacterium]OUV68434.1 MAG: hypothetical protein CBC93_01750 [Gammaproteobacteria bacterium TMED133]RZO77791.1 MAG: MOSC domain-containing protein [OM182 bacterium]
MHVASVNLGKRELIQRLGQGKLSTGINKRPISDRIIVGALGLVGDAIINTKHHGGPDQAIYLYREEDYRYWSNKLDRDLPPGAFGENITVSGLPAPYLDIGDKLVFDDLMLEVTAPRIPCSTLAAKMNDKFFPKKFIKAELPGIYCRVLQTGSISKNDKFYIDGYIGDQINTNEFFGDLLREISKSQIQRYLRLPIDSRSRKKFDKDLKRLQ